MNLTSTMDIILWIWFVLSAVSVAYVAWDLFTRTPEMKVMKWGWILVTLYTGIFGLIVYWFSCREPAPYTHEKFIAPLWKQAVGSTIHCMAGDATGIIVAAAITSLLGLPMGVDAVIEYFAGFAFGLFIFQALFMKDMLGGNYWQAVKSTVLPEWLSMNAVMAGMIPTMIILMTRDMQAMEPTSLKFWGIMSLATLIGSIPAYPINVWLVYKGLKHGMGTERALGKGGAKIETERQISRGNESDEMETMPKTHHSAMPDTKKNATAAVAPSHEMSAMGGMKMGGGNNVPISSKIIVTLITIAMLTGGFWLAARYGDLSMRAGEMNHETPMPNIQMNH
ncbi:MAG: DUF4396 domain-containing protein [Acidobacteria bacterium]|nr:DUF4396 domain-containing protein [Acidobacteriota bacterium]